MAIKNYLTYPTTVMTISQTYYGRTSHYNHTTGYPKDWPIDESCEGRDRSWFYCPCAEIKVVRISGVGTGGANTIWLQSTSPVIFANGSVDYVTIMVIHPEDDDLKKLSVGQKFNRGQKMFREGGDGGTVKGKHVQYGNHFHISVGKGVKIGNGWTESSSGKWVLTTTNGTIKPEEAFCVDTSFTKVRSSNGLKFKTVLNVTQMQPDSLNISKIIFVGDSRAEGMAAAVTTSHVWSYKSGAGFSWLSSTGLPQIENEVKNAAVCIMMGVNDLGNASKYVKLLNDKAKSWTSTVIYFVSVNPVDEASEASHGYKVKNKSIVQFNRDVKSGLSNQVRYIDTYNAIINDFSTTDGVHYTAQTYKNIHDIIVAQVISTTSSDPSGYDGTGTEPQTYDYTTISPYVMMLNRKSEDPKWADLSANKIIGAIVEAGYLYNDSGKEVSVFENPNLKHQLTELANVDIPFGLSMICRAKTLDQARDEMYRLSFSVRRYPPKLGVWLDLKIPITKLSTDILNIYDDELIRLGLVGKIGVICNRSTLSKIEWDKFQDKFMLLLVDHVKSTDVLDTLLDPEFFDTDGKSG